MYKVPNEARMAKSQSREYRKTIMTSATHTIT